MNRELTGIIGQYGACALMAIGLTYELISGADVGWFIFSIGCLTAVIATKIRGK